MHNMVMAEIESALDGKATASVTDYDEATVVCSERSFAVVDNGDGSVSVDGKIVRGLSGIAAAVREAIA